MQILDLDRLAVLAKIHLTSEEKESLSRQLPAILEYVGKLQEVDVSIGEAQAFVTKGVNVWRDDVPLLKNEEREAVIAAFPQSKGNVLEVPGVFGD